MAQYFFTRQRAEHLAREMSRFTAGLIFTVIPFSKHRGCTEYMVSIAIVEHPELELINVGNEEEWSCVMTLVHRMGVER